MSKFKNIIAGMIVGLIVLIGFVGTVSAQPTTGGATENKDKDYTVLAPLPGTTKADGKTTDLQTYLPGVFKLTMGIAAVMAFVMITFGGITYATSDAVFKKSQGKEFIENALWGLLLVIGAWAILNTINPQILKFDLNIDRPNIKPGETSVVAGTNGVPMTAEQIAADTAVRARLAGINVNHGPCTAGQTSCCTNLNGLGEGAIQGLQTLNKDCKSQCGVITINGGTEDGHQTHGVGESIVDLDDSPALEAWLKNNKYMTTTGSIKAATVPLSSGRVARFKFEETGGNPNGTSSGPHWHVVF